MAEIRAHPVKQTYSTVRLLCRSLAGNDVYFITITSPQVPGETKVSPPLLRNLPFQNLLSKNMPSYNTRQGNM